MTYRILVGDVLDRLADLDDASIQTVITSPPYWGLRDYGTAEWDGGDAGCDHLAPLGGGFMSSTLTHGPGKPLGESETEQVVRNRQKQYGATCAKCGARRIDSQLGLEPTPEAYVERMVEVFRQVRRVLRDDGTVWLNLGDSYANGGTERPGSADGPEVRPHDRVNRRPAPNKPAAPGLKPKDLVGIPWSVAKALQAPYYTGRIRRDLDRMWLAAMLDAEGCLFIHKRKAGQHNGQGYYRKNDSYGPGVEIANTSLAVVERIMALVGKGSISTQGPNENARRKQTIYRWNLRTIECRDFVRELYPYLVAKQQQARILIGCPSSGERAEAAHAALMALHRTGLSDVDFPAPASMYEPGWYLRSDIVWSKANPMPESVTDRPTKSHEYLFLLTKSARYYFDADAVREAHGDSNASRLSALHEHGDGAVGEWGPGSAQEDDPHRSQLKHRGLPGVGTTFGRFNSTGRNIRTVWNIATESFPGAHFATFPKKLVEPCVKAGTSEKGCCAECGTPWARIVAREVAFTSGSGAAGNPPNGKNGTEYVQAQSGDYDVRMGPSVQIKTTGWRPSCRCCHVAHSALGAEAADCDGHRPVPCTVLDPFCGSGTTGLVALRHGRSFVGIELNPAYAEMARNRIHDDGPLFNVEAV